MTRQELRVKEYLSRAFYDELSILSFIDELERIDAMMYRTNKINEAGKVQGGKHHTLEDLIVKFLDYKTMIKEQIDSLRKEVEEITKVINRVKDARCQTLLIMRYIRHMKWEDIAVAMTYEKRWITNLHMKAIRELVKMGICK